MIYLQLHVSTKEVAGDKKKKGRGSLGADWKKSIGCKCEKSTQVYSQTSGLIAPFSTTTSMVTLLSKQLQIRILVP